jgi:hypothetical protein
MNRVELYGDITDEQYEIEELFRKYGLISKSLKKLPYEDSILPINIVEILSNQHAYFLRAKQLGN